MKRGALGARRAPYPAIAAGLVFALGCAPAPAEPTARPPANEASAMNGAPGTDPSDEPDPAPPPPGEIGAEDEAVMIEAPEDPRFRACPSEGPEGMACIPGGRFVRGDDEGEPNARPAAEVAVSTYWLDRHEITNGAYAECVAAGECQRLTRFPGYMGADQPAVGMRWQDADAFCRRRGARLPTEAEWERAARGPDGAPYPWGAETEAPCERAIVRTREGRGCGRETTWPVGSRPADARGLFDMAGNVWEWVSDHYASCYEGCDRACGEACLGEDPRGPCGGGDAPCPEARGLRIVRGGSWWYGIERATASSRRGVPGANPNPHRFGFRCAREL